MESYFPSAFSPLLIPPPLPIITFCDELINYCKAARTAYSPCNVQSISSLIGLDEKLFIKPASLGMEIFITNRVQDNSPSPLLPRLQPPTSHTAFSHHQLVWAGRGEKLALESPFICGWNSASSVTQRHSRRSSLPARGSILKRFTSFSSLQATPQTGFSVVSTGSALLSVWEC